MRSRSILAVVATAGLLAATACEHKPTPTRDTSAGSAQPAASAGAKATASATAQATASATAGAAASAASSAEASSRPKPKPRAKAALNEVKPVELPGGKWVDIPGTNGTFQIPQDWKIIEGGPEGWALINSPKETSGLIATTYKKGADPTKLLEQASSNLGFSDCVWQPAEDAVVGQDSFPAKVADGACLLDDAGVYAIYLMAQGGDINVFIMAGWDEDAPEEDQKKVIEIFTTIKKKG